MLVSILGCPCSGKTTTAAMVFAYLKQTDIPTEFVTEQARLFIAEARVEARLKPTDVLALDDQAQIDIMAKQLHIEDIMKKACGPSSVIVCDSSALNSLLYMSKEALQDTIVQGMLKQALEQYDAIYYATPLDHFPSFDPNRIHDEGFSRDLDGRIPLFVKEYLPSDFRFSARLAGEPIARMNTMVEDLMKRILA